MIEDSILEQDSISLQPQEAEQPEAGEISKKKSEDASPIHKIYFRNASFEIELQSTSLDCIALIKLAKTLKAEMQNGIKTEEKAYFG